MDRISTSVFVTNFPDSASAKDLFKACNQYGHVIDSYIPNKKSKSGKRFGFVKFINVFSEERLINNLCTVWIGRSRIHANIAHFQRVSGKKKERVEVPKPFVYSSSNAQGKPNIGVNSYVGVVRGKENMESVVQDSTPSIVLSDDCLMKKVCSNAIFGRVKDFASLANLKVALGNEGFGDVVIKYMGELWVMMEFKSKVVIHKFQECTSVMSWFSQVVNATPEFEVEGRIAWVEVEGIPFKLWTRNTFARVAEIWGKLLDVDDEEETCYHSKRLCIHMQSRKSINENFKIIHKGKTFWIRAIETPGWVPDFTDAIENDDTSSDNEDVIPKSDDFGENSDSEKVPDTIFEDEELENNHDDRMTSDKIVEESDDPFKLYPLLNRNDSSNKHDKCSDSSLSHPPGYTPHVTKCEEERSENIIEKQDTEDHSENNFVNNSGSKRASSGHFKSSDVPRTGGSILHCLEELVKVGQTMGYDMGGCENDIMKMIDSHGVDGVHP